MAFSYISNEQLKFEIKNTILFMLAPKNEMLRYKSNKILYIYMRETTKL